MIAIQGLPGILNPTYLLSAIAAPQQTWHYTNGGVDLFDLAAVYLYHIASAHAFADGNKRTGYATALVFLAVNGHRLLLPNNITELAQATVDAEEGRIGKADLAAIMRRMAQDLVAEK